MTRVFCQLLILFSIISVSATKSGNDNPQSWNPYSTAFRHSSPSQDRQKNKNQKHSFTTFKIDPKSLINRLCKYGGIILPKNLESDLNIFANTCQCDEISLDLINRKLEVLNFTVSLPDTAIRNTVTTTKSIHNKDPALHVKRLTVHWDSYLKPCLVIEVEDVDILVEFVNIIFTRNNWNELQDYGFPPTFSNDTITDLLNKESLPTMNKKPNTFITIGSIDLSGQIILKLHSRVLDEQKIVNDLSIDLSTFDPINEQIKYESLKALEKNDRRGCTTDQLYEIIKESINSMINKALKRAATDITFRAMTNDQKTGEAQLNQVKNVMESSKDTLLKYAKNVGKKTNNDIDRNLSELGLSSDQIDIAKKISNELATNIFGLNNNKGHRK